MISSSELRNFLFLVLVIISFVNFSAAQSYDDNFQIHVGEELKAGDYKFTVEKPRFGESGLQLEVKEELDNTNKILFQENINSFSGDEVREYSVPEENMDLNVNSIGWSEKGRYLNITVESDQNIFSGTELEANLPENVVISREEEISVPLTLKNKGTNNQSMSLNYNASSGIQVSFSYGGFNVTSIEVGSGESETVSSSMEIKEETPLGKQNVTFTASGDSKATDQISFYVKGSKKERSLSMELDKNFIQSRPGETIRVTPMVRNTGDVELEGFELDMKTPEGWTEEERRSRTVSESSNELRQRERERYYKRINIPADTGAGDYYIEFTPKSNEVTGDTKEVRVSIREKSGMSNVGIGLMVVSLLGMIITYRKLGRR